MSITEPRPAADAMTRNVRVFVHDLTHACRTAGLSAAHIVKAGGMYATLETSEVQRQRLDAAGVFWTDD